MSRLTTDIRAALDLLRCSSTEPVKFKLFLLIRLLPFLKEHWLRVFSAAILMLVTSLLAMPGPYLTKVIVDDILPARRYDWFSLALLALILLLFLRLAFSFLVTYNFTVLNQEVIISLKQTLFQ
jgi:ABC-type bacteriocin/lantibiotic exporter with double-glycine peptidase domain